jgi:uncharacterized membrane protein YgdD (TMEM256/DUF423 family)
MNHRPFLIAACLIGALAVGLGAFGAHALEDTLTPERIETWNTAVTYHMWHSLAVLILIIISKIYDLDLKWALTLMLVGIGIFSGSLYLLCLSGISWLGAITPIGGVCFIIGWLFLPFKLLKDRKGLDQ